MNGSGGNFFQYERLNNNVDKYVGLRSNTEWFVIDNSISRVGIGTTGPLGKLELSGTSENESNLILHNTGPAANNTKIQFYSRPNEFCDFQQIAAEMSYALQ